MKHIPIILILILTGCSWSKSEIKWGIASTIATGADIYTTTRMLDNPRNHECNPLMGRHPSDTRVIIHMAGFQVLALTMAHFVPEWRSWILGGKTGINTICTINNMNLDWNE